MEWMSLGHPVETHRAKRKRPKGPLGLRGMQVLALGFPSGRLPFAAQEPAFQTRRNYASGLD
jgi:hypothetical protein